MRIAVLFPLALVAACSSPGPGNNSADAANAAAPAAVGAETPLLPNGMRGAEPATSASAIEATKLVAHYFALIEQKKFAEARMMWGNGGADVGGDAAAFARTITPYSVYQPKVGTPSHIMVADGKQFVNVMATLHVQRRDNKAEADRNGVVMLYRSIDPNDKNADKRDWKIRGVDIRVRN